jgi:hypothetical protein
MDRLEKSDGQGYFAVELHRGPEQKIGWVFFSDEQKRISPKSPIRRPASQPSDLQTAVQLLGLGHSLAVQ